MNRALLEMIFRMPIAHVVTVFDADSYETMLEIATPSERILLHALAGQAMRLHDEN